MGMWLGLATTIALLMLAVARGIYIGWPLIAGCLYFAAMNHYRGWGFREIWAVVKESCRKPFIVVPILLLIGAVISLWMASGTVGALVYYSLALIDPALFIAWAFVLCALISMLLGTAFGTVGTIGVILMVLARGSGVDIYMTAGAIASGIYVGDRCSPMSSALYLLSSVTETDPQRNLGMLLKTSLLPVLLTTLIYGLISPYYPLLAGETTLRGDIAANFDLSWPTFMPALIMLVLAVLRRPVKNSMLISALSAGLIAAWLQGMSGAEMAATLLWGYHPAEGNALAGIIQGGGLWIMAKTAVVVLSASCFTALLEQAGAMKTLGQLLLKPSGPLLLYLKTLLVSLVSICCGCSQTIGIIVSGRLMQEPYRRQGLDNYALARDISYTAIPISALIPWNTAALVPMATLGLEKALHIPFIFYGLMLPLIFGMPGPWRKGVK